MSAICHLRLAEPGDPGPQPCNQIPATYHAAVEQAKRGREPADDPLDVVRRFLAQDVDLIAATLLELTGRIDRLERRLGVRR